MRTPSSTTALAPTNTLSSTITGLAEGGSKTPANTAPAPIWARLPTVARAPKMAPISIMVSSPTTAPILITAPIMTTAFFPITAWSRINAPGSIRASTLVKSNSGTAELRRSFSK